MLGNQKSLKLYLLPLINIINRGYIPNTYSARAVKIVPVAHDMLLITLKVSRRWKGFVAGQHISLTLRANGKLVTRTFSVCSSTALWQSQRQIQLCCKINKKGSFTPLLLGIKPKTKVNISNADGEFVWRHPTQRIVFIAAGSGITPLISMLLSQRHWLAPVHLVYRIRKCDSIPFLTELQNLAVSTPIFSFEISDSQQESAERFINKLQQKELAEQYFLCGPQNFMRKIWLTLRRMEIEEACIKQEQFGLNVMVNDLVNETNIHGTFLHAGAAKKVLLDSRISLLQNAEQHGLSPSFGCRMGVCFQCVCQKISGQVRNVQSGVLSGLGEEQIQLCISQPVSELTIKL
jgi:stearoyl-CoA 9-desaturase NADPH oxidoreductase